MTENFEVVDLAPSETYSDPIGKAKARSISYRFADSALAGDMPVSRLFSNVSSTLLRDIFHETRRERAENQTLTGQ